MKRGSNLFEWTHKKLNGKDFPATVLLSRIELKGKKFLQATVRGITEKKKVEEELKGPLKAYEKALKKLSSKYKDMPSRKELEEVFGKKKEGK
ncbi:MAG: hypothetical protein QF824_04130 [Candidatus Woesearchaeota archaeon]|jgi:hypothetical protein|nr:hypothetical protein [Candidatus Woesearchaeota archaeon]|tara:strand:- start:378 stop:656 length:279 start_codon:yes stop_codon:yes gene_type:complete